MSQHVLSVWQINEYIRAMMDADVLLSAVAVRGEISNYKAYPSGHHYFSLKDDTAVLRCVMFRANAMRLKFRPQNGMKVIVVGKISTYPRDGSYQLNCSAMIVDGVGDLYVAYEQLKKKLEAEGLFDAAHKKEIPKYPGTIGIITSSAGAAVHDILRILKKRYPLSVVRLLPVRVQGAEAPGEISDAIAFANAHKLADLLIVGRGGGSIEDLWAFNDERVARAIYCSEIPIISAVGHEPDVTISDFVADLRAATPSNAAELAVPDQDALRQQLDNTFAVLVTAMQQQIQAARRQLAALSERPALRSTTAHIDQQCKDLRLLNVQLHSAINGLLSSKKQRYLATTASLDALSPLKVLSRGYAIAHCADGKIVRSVNDINPGDQLAVRIADGSFTATVVDTKEETV